MRHYRITASDFRRLVEEILGCPATVRLEWTDEERGFECDWYLEGYELWLNNVEVEGQSETGVAFKRLVWQRFTESLYMDEHLLEPLSERLKLDTGELRMIYGQKGHVSSDGWPTSEEVGLGYLR